MCYCLRKSLAALTVLATSIRRSRLPPQHSQRANAAFRGEHYSPGIACRWTAGERLHTVNNHEHTWLALNKLRQFNSRMTLHQSQQYTTSAVIWKMLYACHSFSHRLLRSCCDNLLLWISWLNHSVRPAHHTTVHDSGMLSAEENMDRRLYASVPTPQHSRIDPCMSLNIGSWGSSLSRALSLLDMLNLHIEISSNCVPHQLSISGKIIHL